MKHDDENQSGGGFLDKNTITAIVLSFLVFFGWQTYMGKKYPNKAAPNTSAPKATSSPELNSGTGENSASIEKATDKKTSAPDSSLTQVSGEKQSFSDTPNVEKKTLQFTSDKFDISFTNSGFGIQKISLKEFSDREGRMIEYDSAKTAELLMATTIDGFGEFDIRKMNEREFEGTLNAPHFQAVKSFVIDSEKYLIKTNIKIRYLSPQKLNLTNKILGAIEKVDKTLFLPAYEHQELFVATADKSNREYLDVNAILAPTTYTTAKVAAFNAQYFALAAINTSDIAPVAEATSDGKIGKISVIYQTSEPKVDHNISYDFYFGPKKMELLSTISEPLEELIDYGMFSVIGRPLLAIMKVIYSFFTNWGIAIILLTVLVKTVLFPLHMYSIKSMKKMQKIQPRLKELKEKYKSDPQRMNQETLQLMKTEKANPLSGCLPALMQIPIFIALYSMLGKSFELYKQPFFLWINDLSAKDPYFVLPLLAGGVFFIQQKLTPTTGMDPAQAKVMMFMPIMITAFMLTVPSGLALYMFVNAVFSVFQQLIVMREKTT